MSTETEELLTVEEVAALLKVPISWVYSRTRTRRGETLPHIRLGKYIRFREEDVREYLAKNQRGPELSSALK